MPRPFLHRLLLGLACSDSSTFEAEGLRGAYWLRREHLSYLCLDDGGEPFAGYLRIVPGQRHGLVEAIVKHARAGDEVQPSLEYILRDPPLDAVHRTSEPKVLAEIERFVSAIDHEAMDLLLSRSIYPDGRVYRYVAGRKEDRRLRVSMLAAYPWASGIVTAGDPGTPVRHDEDLARIVANACLSRTRMRVQGMDADRAEEIVLGLRNADLPVHVQGDMAEVVTLASTLPDEMVPDLEEEGREEFEAMACLIHVTMCHAKARGKPLDRCPAPPSGSWTQALFAILSRCNPELRAEDMYAREAVERALGQAEDMVQAFKAHVVGPALASAYPDAALWNPSFSRLSRNGLGGLPWFSGDDEGLALTAQGIATRLLVRDKSLAGFLEEVGSWHRNMVPISTRACELAADVDWGRAFQDWAAPDGTSFTCLSTPADLVEEGRAMRNCVATYLERCRSRESVVVSVRAKGERVATMELIRRWGAVGALQIEGPGNTVPPASVSEAGQTLVWAINGGGIPLAYGSLVEEGTSDIQASSNPEHYSVMRDAWASYLAKPMRTMSARQLLAAAGLDERHPCVSPPSSPRPKPQEPQANVAEGGA